MDRRGTSSKRVDKDEAEESKHIDTIMFLSPLLHKGEYQSRFWHR